MHPYTSEVVEAGAAGGGGGDEGAAAAGAGAGAGEGGAVDMMNTGKEAAAEEERAHWGSTAEFILAAIGSAVGLVR